MAENPGSISGRIFDIQRFSLDDGPGIRTVVFFKGCNMVCPWCHNPEFISDRPELFRTYSKCRLCGTCIEICPAGAVSLSDNMLLTDYNKCNLCGACIDACPAGSIRQSGYEISVEDLVAVVAKDREYYQRSGGGVTFSGGEPTLQYDFLLESLMECKKNGIMTALDTNGSLDHEKMLKLLDYTDQVLLDFKHISKDKHKKFTCMDNTYILNMLGLLSGKAEVEIRVLVIPSFNDTADELKAIIEKVKEYDFRKIRLLPYHVFRKGKYKSLGRNYKLTFSQPIEEDAVRNLVFEVDAAGIEIIIDAL